MLKSARSFVASDNQPALWIEAEAIAPTAIGVVSASAKIKGSTPFNMGAVYTPHTLATWVAQQLAAHLQVQSAPIILDPACGDGALLMASRQVFGKGDDNCCLVGVDLDAEALEQAANFTSSKVHLYHADALAPLGKKQKALYQWRALLEQIGIGQVDGVIANPPWGADIRLTRKQLQALGYELAQGQFDSYDLFIEICLQFGAPNATCAFILPDSIFLPEHKALRKLLLRETQLLLVARLGEGFFPGVFRGAMVLVFRKALADEKHTVKCLRLTKEWRQSILSGHKTLEDAEATLSHFVPQQRFANDAHARFDIDAQTSEVGVLDKVTQVAMAWTKWLESGRGVEISKHGQVLICPFCQSASPLPRGAETLHCVCKECGHSFRIAQASRQSLTRKIAYLSTPGQDALDSEWLPFIVGEDVDRYACHPSREIRLGVAGINYKAPEIFAHRKLLVRKTGVGLKAAIDESGALTNQVVFHYYASPERMVPPFFLDYVQGVLSSRVMFAYHLKRGGENEWRSHPYVTQQVLATLPIPEIVSQPRCWKQAQAIAKAVKKRAQGSEHDSEADILVDCLVAGLYELTPLECEWVSRVLDGAEGLEPMRALRLSDPRALKPVHCA